MLAYLHFLVLYIIWIRKFAEKAFNLVLKYRRSFFDNVLNVFKHDVLNLNRSKRHN